MLTSINLNTHQVLVESPRTVHLLLFKLVAFILVLLASNDAHARRVYIDPVTPTQSSATVGNTSVAIVTRRNPIPGVAIEAVPDTTYIEWRVIPESAATIIESEQPESLFIRPNTSIELQFLESGTVTVIATGFDTEDLPDEPGGEDRNDVVFTFNVTTDPEAPGTTPGNTVHTPLTANQRVTQSGMARACDPTPAASLDGEDGDNTLRAQMLARLQATCDALEMLDDPSNALDRIAAEELFAIGDALTLTADQQLGNVQSRINAVRSGQRNAFDISSMSLQLWDQRISGRILSESARAIAQFASGGNGASADILSDSTFGIFANGNVAVGEIDGDGIQRDADLSTTTLTLGTDYRIDNNRVIGAALGIVSDDTDFKGDSGNLDMQSFGITAFGTWYREDKGYADIVLDISQNDFNLDRRINLPGQPTEFTRSSTSATRFALGINVGRTIQRGATEFGPIARIRIMRASVGGFTETPSLTTNGTGTALRIDSHSVSSASFAVGGELKHVINTRKAVFVPSARLTLEVENQTDKGTITAAFINDVDATPMNIEGAERDQTALLLNVGTTAVLRHGRSAFVNFETRRMDDRVSRNQLRVGYRMLF